MSISRLLIISVTTFFIILLHQSLLCFAGNKPQTSSLYYPVNDDYRNQPLNSIPNPRKWLFGFGAVNTIATLITIQLTLLSILVYKLRELHELNFSHKFDGLSLLPSEKICRQFSLGEILLATNYFDDSLVIGRGGFGKVYKGVIDNGASIVAIKRLGYMSKQGATEFRAEITMLSKFRHSNVVSLIGYCETYNEMILVYEYIVHGTIADHLYKTREKGGSHTPLRWVQRLKICIGAARGLDYLHTGTGIKERVIHRDVKSSNILLDENWAARISDFGLSKVGPANQSFTHVSTNVKGTFGYLDPEYFYTHRLTRKSDVYAFGVVLFEVLCGRPALDFRLDESQRSLAQWAQYCVKEGIVESIVDPSLTYEIFSDSLSAFVRIADKCLCSSPKERPTMSEVVAELECSLTSQERRADSLAEEYIFSDGEAFDSQEIVDSSVEENAVNIVEEFVTKEVLLSNVDNGERQEKKVGKAFDFGRMKFTKKFRTFFPVTTQRISRKNAVSHAIEAAPTDPNDKVTALIGKEVEVAVPIAVVIEPILVAPISTDEIREMTNDFSPKNFICSGANDKQAVNIEPNPIEVDELKEITDKFSLETFICHGTNSIMFHGILKSGRASCIKVLLSNKLPEKEFIAQVTVKSMLKHENVVELLGYCLGGDDRVLAYEYATNGSLHDILHGQKGAENAKPGPVLSWSQRVKIAVGAAKGLAYLLENIRWPILNIGITSCNVLLFEDYNVTKVGVTDSWNNAPGISAQIYYIQDYMTSGYCAPEIGLNNEVKDFGIPIGEFGDSSWYDRLIDGKKNSENDIYSFGVLLLELLTGRKPIDDKQPFEEQRLVTWATPKLGEDKVKLFMDPRLNGEYPPTEVAEMAAIAALCVQHSAAFRPSISNVVERLERLVEARLR